MAASGEPFERSRDLVESLITWLSEQDAAGLTHADLEARLDVDGRAVLRQMLQDHLDLRAVREQRLAGVVDADGVPRARVEAGRERGLACVFGEVRVRRHAYRQLGHADLHPADAVLNLPAEKYSHGLRRLTVVESVRGSYADAATAIWRVTGQRLGNRQVEQLARRAAVDFDAFYASRRRHLSIAGALLVLTFDAKGVVMRPAGLREATAKAAGRAPRRRRRRGRPDQRC